MKKITLILFLFAVFVTKGQIVVNTSTYTVPQLVQNVLVNSTCAQVSNFTSQGNCGIGYFQYSGSDFAFNNGVIIRTGNANFNSGSYSGNNISSVCSNVGDAELQAISNANGQTGSINDVSYIKFNFTPYTDNFSFNFIFASNEYGTYQCGYGDVFAFILTDLTTGVSQNLAVIPGTSTPVSVLNIRDAAYNGACSSVNQIYFDEYSPSLPVAQTEMNMKGFTVPFTAEATVVPGHNYTIKLVIGDYGDNDFDSAVFIEGGSFNVGTAEISFPLGVGVQTGDMTIANGTALCPGQSKVISTGLNPANFNFVWTKDGINLGINAPSITVSSAGTYCVSASIIGSPGACVQTDCIIVEYFPSFNFVTPPSLTICNNITPQLYNLNSVLTTIFGANNISDFDYGFYLTQADAINNTNMIPSAQWGAYPGTSGQIVYFGAESLVTGATCRESVPVTLLQVPCTVTTPPNLVVCDDSSNDGFATFNLDPQTPIALGSNNPANYNVTYHTSLSDANGDLNAISPANSFTNTVNPQTIYIRLEESSNAANFTTTSFQLQVVSQPTVTISGTASICNGGSTNLTFTGTPNAQVNYTDGTNALQTTLNSSGTSVVSVTPTVTTTYSLVNAMITTPPGCTNPQTGSATVTVSSQVVGTLSYSPSSFCTSDLGTYSPSFSTTSVGSGSCAS
uniref:choice-of-anchor L domain-containing protein n=1 Tax=Flavobacterium sp. TaxID=239 RepID=UPI0035B3749E